MTTLDDLIDALVDLRSRYGGDLPVVRSTDLCLSTYGCAITGAVPVRVAKHPTSRGMHYLPSRRPGAKSGVLGVLLEG